MEEGVEAVLDLEAGQEELGLLDLVLALVELVKGAVHTEVCYNFKHGGVNNYGEGEVRAHPRGGQPERACRSIQGPQGGGEDPL